MGVTAKVMSDRWIWAIEHTFATDTAEAKRVLEELLSQLAENGWSDHEIFGTHMAVEEALMNAIKHGNQLDPEKDVEVISQLADDQLIVEITDQGEGFSPEEVPDPTAEENLELPSGRGLMLMRNFMSVVQFNEVGNSVRMVKHRSL